MEYTLVGVNGNAFAILGYVQEAMKKEGYNEEEIGDYVENAVKVDYDHLVSTSIDMIHNVNLKKRQAEGK